jgi:hypothetical protein
MWNYTVNWAIQILSQYPEVKHELHSHNSHWFNFHDLIYLRFKKLGDDLRPSNLKTKRISGIGCQAEIPGFPNKPTFVEAGYILDKTSSEFQDIYIICWSNDQKVWEINLVKEAGLQLDIFDNEITAKENLKSILKVKEEYKNQNRLDGSFN